jgi:hypothetical protein
MKLASHRTEGEENCLFLVLISDLTSSVVFGVSDSP